MDDNSIEVRKEFNDGGAESEPVAARDIWRGKLQSGREAEAGSGQAQSGANHGHKEHSGMEQGNVYGPDSSGGAGRSKAAKVKRKKPLIIFGCILIGVIILAGLVRVIYGSYSEGKRDISGASSVHGEHIGVLYVEGTIGLDSDTYNHQYALDAVDGMMENDSNRGLMLFVNTPGGGVYESDELYFKIKEYQETTGRPVYAYFASQATSGGYYISASADKIVANRNCWTGSIGVTIGTLYDISGLLEKYGIETETITSGANKAMGSITDPMTDEQKKIFQGLVDEAYEQFVSIVAEGRNLKVDYVKSIADGRIYTAKQAKDIGLVDDVVYTYDEAITDMMSEYSLFDCEVREFRYVPEYGLLDSLIQSVDKLADALSKDSDVSALTQLMEEKNELPLQYICEEIK